MKKNRQQCLDTLAFGNLGMTDSHVANPHTTSCRGLLQCPEYLTWINPDEIPHHHGKPGSGKSTLMKFLLAHAKENLGAESAVACFFFNARGHQLEKSTAGMHRSLLLQLLVSFQSLQEALDDLDLTKTDRDGNFPIAILRNAFRRAVTILSHRSFTCFIELLTSAMKNRFEIW